MRYLFLRQQLKTHGKGFAKGKRFFDELWHGFREASKTRSASIYDGERNYACHNTRQKDFTKRFLAKRRRRRKKHGKHAQHGCLQNTACADE